MAVHNAIQEIFDLTGKVAIVTGGARGIGEGLSIRLAQAGAKVVACDLDADGLEKAINKFKGMGLEVSGVRADISVEADCANVVQKAVEIYGGLDIMVNNAAYFPTIPFLDVTLADWEKVYSINARGAFLTTREATKVLVKQNEKTPDRGGSIILIATLGAYRPNRVGMSTYHSSKGAVLSLKNHLCGELAPHNIRVNCILPGAINSMRPDENGEYQPLPLPVEKVPLRTMGIPFDIANAALFLASPAGRYVTGVELPVDGGLNKLPSFGYPEEQKVLRDYSVNSNKR